MYYFNCQTIMHSKHYLWFQRLVFKILCLSLSPIRGVFDTWGTRVPYFIIRHQSMIDKVKIENLVKEFTAGTGLFLVAVKISSSGKIIILADKKGGITIEECASISRFIESRLNRDEEDFELQVSSPGLNVPFIVKEQYYKSEGKIVEVTDDEGKKFSGLLKNVNEGGFEIETEVRTKGKGKDKRDLSFNYDQIKSTREVVSFK